MARRRAPLVVGLVALIIGSLLLWLDRSTGPGRAPATEAVTAASGPREAGPASPPPTVPGVPPARFVPAATGPRPDGSAWFEGHVVSSASGLGIGGAELTFARAGAAASVRADAEGAFRFETPAVGRWLLASVTAPGYLPFAPEWGHSPIQLEALSGQAVRGLEIQLAPARVLAGRVVDEEGKPVAGASVRLLGSATEAALVPIADRFTSGADGTFSFTAPAGATLEAEKAGLRPGRATVDALALVNRRLTIELGPRSDRPRTTAPVSGRVVARGGGPIEGALVTAQHEGPGGQGGDVEAQALTGGDGAFTLAELGPGRYRVAARAERFATGALRRVAPGDRDLLLELVPGGRLRGCVRDGSSGAPVAALTVLVFERRSSLRLVPQQGRSVVDAGGCWALDDLTPGPASVVISAPGYAPSAPLPIEVPPSGEGVVDATLERGGRLVGRVVDAESRAPLAGATLQLEGQLDPAASAFPVLAQAETGADGGFALSGLPARFSLQVAAAGHHARIASGLEIGSGETRGPIELALRAVAPGEEPRVELAGIGAVLRAGGEVLVVSFVDPAGGAAEAGLGRGDQLLEVNGRPVSELGMTGAIDAIRGPEGSTVVLTVRHGEGAPPFRITVTRRLVRG